MNTAKAIVSDSESVNALQCLANRIDTPTLDGFLERLFTLAVEEEGAITCHYAEQRIRIDSNERALYEMEFPHAKSALRMVCARLAVRCGEWANRSVNPYGDRLSLIVPLDNHPFAIAFENSAALQSITIELMRSIS